jgi:hypothetical protein
LQELALSDCHQIFDFKIKIFDSFFYFQITSMNLCMTQQGLLHFLQEKYQKCSLKIDLMYFVVDTSIKFIFNAFISERHGIGNLVRLSWNMYHNYKEMCIKKCLWIFSTSIKLDLSIEKIKSWEKLLFFRQSMKMIFIILFRVNLNIAIFWYVF